MPTRPTPAQERLHEAVRALACSALPLRPRLREALRHAERARDAAGLSARLRGELREHAKAGITEVSIHQIGDDQAGFLEFWVHELAPALTSHGIIRDPRPPGGS
jgi:hypothetical protein